MGNGKKMSLKVWVPIFGSKTKHKPKQLRLSTKASGKMARGKASELFIITTAAVFKVPSWLILKKACA